MPCLIKLPRPPKLKSVPKGSSVVRGRYALVTALLTFAFVMLPGIVHADLSDFTITNFSGDYTLSNADPQGELRIVERINVIFRDYNHGILRAIPNTYKKHKLQIHVNRISSDSVAPTQFTTYQSNGNTVLKIGDPNRTITGPQQYTIDYTVRNVISFYPDHDELYWDVNGDQWMQPFDQVTAAFHLPSGVQRTIQSPVCFTGAFGSTDKACQVQTNGKTITVQATSALAAYETLSSVIGFQKGYFRPANWYETLAEYSKQLAALLLPPLVIGGWAFLYWRKYGRDAKGRGTIVPQYDAPDKLKPIEVGGLVDFKVENRDMTATIIDLAIRKYIKIIETKKNRMLGKDKLDYSFELLNPNTIALAAIEQDLVKGMFGDTRAVTVSELKKGKFYTTVKKIHDSVHEDLTKQGYFRSNPTKSTTRMIAVIVILLIVMVASINVLTPWLLLGNILAIGIVIIFSVLMPSRTAKGVAAREHAEGLKLYLNTAEKERLKMLQGPDAPYAASAHEPTKTVALFEKLLPYAIVMGVEKDWAAQFKDIYTQPPDWYGGNWATFNAVVLTSNLSGTMQSSMDSAFSAPSSSSSSGFGGGFSGGGGGGGGGGGW